MHRTPKPLAQTTLDHFSGFTITRSSPSELSSSQDSLSPSDNLNVSTIQSGTVVRNEEDFEVALDNTVSVISPQEQRIRDKVYGFTYQFTDGVKYLWRYVGKLIGKRVQSLTIHDEDQLKALQILSSGIDAVQRINKNHYKVRSMSDKTRFYNVTRKRGEGWKCECHVYQVKHLVCKHMVAIEFYNQLRLQSGREPSPDKITLDDTIECPECKSINVVKNGTRKCHKGINQRYLCKSCRHRFVVDKELSRIKATEKTLAVAMDLYFKGTSLAKIQQHLQMFYNTKVHRTTILRWIKKFSIVLSNYADSLQPEVGDVWNGDEMVINIRTEGEEHHYDWIWNMMDADTRFLLASTITNERSLEEARLPLKQARSLSGKRPKAFITDGLQTYKKAVKKEYYSRKDCTTHFRTPSYRKYFLNQNIERLNGTIRERLKVMRGLNSMETAQILINGERFYYNFIRPHESLGGMTPAMMANLSYVDPSDNAWLVYIKTALRYQNPAPANSTKPEAG